MRSLIVCLGGSLLLLPLLESMLESPFEPPLDSQIALQSMQERTELTTAYLLDVEQPAVEVKARALRAIGGRRAHEAFEGEVRFGAVRGKARFAHPMAKKWKLEHLPAFVARFTSENGYLIPFERELIVDKSPDCAWNVVLSPGRIWSEKGDGGWSRAAFPFLLANKLVNGSLNCVGSFVYKSGKVSDLHVQIQQETYAEFRGSMVARLRLGWTIKKLAGSRQLRESFHQELEDSLPRRALADLSARHKGFDITAFTEDISAKDISQAAVLYRGALYVQQTTGPRGPFPFPRFQRHAAYSLTKSMGLGLAMMRLAELYGPEVYAEKLIDHVDTGSRKQLWSRVRFRHCLDMATGLDWPDRVDSKRPRYDEASPRFLEWLLTWGRDKKLALALDQKSLPVQPGQIFRYQTVASYLLTTALQHWIEKKRGKHADIGDFLRNEVFAPIGIRHMPMMRTIETSGARGQAILGYGLYPTLEDLARIALLLQQDGIWKGRRLLHAPSLERSLFRGQQRGLPTGVNLSDGIVHYQDSFWGLPCKIGERSGFAPYMSGHGGNALLLAPGGASYLRFLDSKQYVLAPMLHEIMKLR